MSENKLWIDDPNGSHVASVAEVEEWLMAQPRMPPSARLGARLGNWNDRRSNHDRRADASWSYRLIDRVAGWLYVRGEQ